ncbi:MAG: hypothetical protein ACHREM_11800 [Polyangiales bacterium]
MHNTEGPTQLRALLREIVLALMGTFTLFEVDPKVETVIARSLLQIAEANHAAIEKPRRARGRAALRALLDELERPDRNSKSEHETNTEASR